MSKSSNSKKRHKTQRRQKPNLGTWESPGGCKQVVAPRGQQLIEATDEEIQLIVGDKPETLVVVEQKGVSTDGH